MCLGVAAIAYQPAIYVSRKGFVVPRIDNRAYRDWLWEPITECPSRRKRTSNQLAELQTVTVNGIKRQSIYVQPHNSYRHYLHMRPQCQPTTGPKRTERADQKGDANYQISANVFFFIIFFSLLDFCVLEPQRTERNRAVPRVPKAGTIVSVISWRNLQSRPKKLSTHC